MELARYSVSLLVVIFSVARTALDRRPSSMRQKDWGKTAEVGFAFPRHTDETPLVFRTCAKVMSSPIRPILRLDATLSTGGWKGGDFAIGRVSTFVVRSGGMWTGRSRKKECSDSLYSGLLEEL